MYGFWGPLQDTCDFLGALTKVVVSLSDEYKAAEGEDSKLCCWVEYVAFRCANMVCLMVSSKYILVLQDSQKVCHEIKFSSYIMLKKVRRFPLPC